MFELDNNIVQRLRYLRLGQNESLQVKPMVGPVIRTYATSGSLVSYRIWARLKPFSDHIQLDIFWILYECQDSSCRPFQHGRPQRILDTVNSLDLLLS